jgi:hypothetical protein
MSDRPPSKVLGHDDAHRLSATQVRGDSTHAWAPRWGMEVCNDCGVVRRRDRMNSPCRGKVRVALRDVEGER